MSQLIEARGWQIEIPDVPFNGKTIVVPTVHPAGDRRVVRCAQSALNAGFGVHFIWMGGVPGEHRHHERVSEYCLPEAGSFKDRFLAMPRILGLALRGDYDGAHIHDYYFLGGALVWKALRRRPVLYDVHEYYAEYYAERLPAGRQLGAVYRPLLEALQVGAARVLGGANVVTERMAKSFRRGHVPIAVTPNFPLFSSFGAAAIPSTPDRLKRVVHVGTMTADYGSLVIAEAAKLLKDLDQGYRLAVFNRYPQETEKQKFLERCRDLGVLDFIEFIEPMASHEVPGELSKHGIGLSLLAATGQNNAAQPAKLFEYAILGLGIVGSQLDGHRRLVQQAGMGRLVNPASPQEVVDAIVALNRDPEATVAAVNRGQTWARKNLTWEDVSSPGLERLMKVVFRS
ncbi:glycosyltransferase [Micrococcales bacterium 31B]|nr:glycosyltransferase [Micrococcales bacterium 31B]